MIVAMSSRCGWTLRCYKTPRPPSKLLLQSTGKVKSGSLLIVMVSLRLLYRLCRAFTVGSHCSAS
jgi:hypothetical protein